MIYMLRCHKCKMPFDAMQAKWCACFSATASLICANCGECFCHAPAPYRHETWEKAPRSLRENPERFRVPVARVDLVVPHAETADDRGPIVLVVDDDESMRSLVACVIEHLGYRTLCAADPIEGLALAAAQNVDLILTDALMPKMDGREMCRRIKERFGSKKKVVVMTSVYRSRQAHNEAIDNFGADDFITKPLDFAQLAKIVTELVPLRADVEVAC
jgi:CheY-like chemotaxis protein